MILSEQAHSAAPTDTARADTVKVDYGDQDENGVDLSLLRRNLRLTPSERWRRHQSALHSMLEIQRAAEAAGLRRRAGRS